MRALHLAAHFLRRDLRNRYLGSFSGGLWALLQPLIQLGVYGFVFVYVFNARVPGSDAPGYVPFLVMGLWPWVAFSESLVRATVAIQENAALIGKVALPREVLVFAATGSSFLIHSLGFCAICLALKLFGVPINLVALPLALLGFVQLFLLALGIGLLFAAIQVFVRDVAQALTQLLTLWMFASPIFYARASLPERYQGWFDFNPFAHYPEFMRGVLLGTAIPGLRAQIVSVIVAAGMLALGFAVFRRLAPHFEDFF